MDEKLFTEKFFTFLEVRCLCRSLDDCFLSVSMTDGKVLPIAFWDRYPKCSIELVYGDFAIRGRARGATRPSTLARFLKKRKRASTLGKNFSQKVFLFVFVLCLCCSLGDCFLLVFRTDGKILPIAVRGH